jgi:hypothetical protein
MRDYRTVQYYTNSFRQAIERYPNTWHGLKGLDPQYKKMRSAVDKLFKQGLIHWRAGRGVMHLEFKAKTK